MILLVDIPLRNCHLSLNVLQPGIALRGCDLVENIERN